MSSAFQRLLAILPAAASEEPAVTDDLLVDVAEHESGPTCVVDPGEAKLGGEPKGHAQSLEWDEEKGKPVVRCNRVRAVCANLSAIPFQLHEIDHDDPGSIRSRIIVTLFLRGFGTTGRNTKE